MPEPLHGWSESRSRPSCRRVNVRQRLLRPTRLPIPPPRQEQRDGSKEGEYARLGRGERGEDEAGAEEVGGVVGAEREDELQNGRARCRRVTQVERDVEQVVVEELPRGGSVGEG